MLEHGQRILGANAWRAQFGQEEPAATAELLKKHQLEK